MVADEKCTGCGACRVACPMGAIALKEETGGLKPRIDRELCTECGACERVCPVAGKAVIPQHSMRKADLFVNNNFFDRGVSSSGGFFKALSDYVFSKHGVVYGAAWCNEYTAVNMVRIKNPDDIYQCMESKYIQADTCNTFHEVEEDLRSGRLVLYAGTPCQIAGLHGCLGQDYENLLTLEVFCHGVPAVHLWQSYLRDYHGHEDVIRYVHFRYKRRGWWEAQMKIQYAHNEYLSSFRNTNDSYMFVFLNNYSLNQACYDCPFRKREHAGDFYIGDAWNINKIKQNMDDDRGISMVVTLTEKAEKILSEVSKGNNVFPVTLEEGVCSSKDLFQSKMRPAIWEKFQQKVWDEGFKSAYELIMEERSTNGK
ncbi:MAG: 4Fe-4S dicluster domain-containing protein [Selenomonas ruminantium]|jgi:coenzyme F420-reducing hydrogenase beta subunit|uniref:4Fe-4S dicluster domain-containing protein n=1 Tax=Selenomonas ruminantium TaxID=971 RepID=A0A927WJ91_SELRU|nr:Coenzyme F420 hydrogenase/dehydrogenase, beta subunit C-terminal domain [Selenomonas ruminantium]MBE6085501.1 4Fe-4S dicluster domain-containing protein [Selenomonas ruminantium]